MRAEKRKAEDLRTRSGDLRRRVSTNLGFGVMRVESSSRQEIIPFYPSTTPIFWSDDHIA